MTWKLETDNFWYKTIWRTQSKPLFSCHSPSYVKGNYTGDKITWLTQFSLQWHWRPLPKWAGNVNLLHLVQSKWKIGEADLKIMNELLTNAVTLDSLILTYIQFVMTLTQSQKVLPQELKCSCNKTNAVLWEWTIQKSVDVSLFHFYCMRNKQTVQKCAYTV
jgi:hypothetical protein